MYIQIEIYVHTTKNILAPCERSKHFYLQTKLKLRKHIIPENTLILCLPLNNIFPTNYDYVKLTFGGDTNIRLVS